MGGAVLRGGRGGHAGGGVGVQVTRRTVDARTDGLSNAAALRMARALLVHHEAQEVIVVLPKWSHYGWTRKRVVYRMVKGRIVKSEQSK